MLKYTHCQPSELEIMPFYEIEILLESLKALSDKEEEERKKQEKAQKGGTGDMNMSSYMRQVQSMQSNAPKLPNFNL